MDDPQNRPDLKVYAVVIALIVVVSAAALLLFGGQTSEILSDFSGTV